MACRQCFGAAVPLPVLARWRSLRSGSACPRSTWVQGALWLVKPPCRGSRSSPMLALGRVGQSE